MKYSNNKIIFDLHIRLFDEKISIITFSKMLKFAIQFYSDLKNETYYLYKSENLKSAKMENTTDSKNYKYS